jgi:acyl-CoA synthetase (AMP-forming)/AMP-acid ligase II
MPASTGAQRVSFNIASYLPLMASRNPDRQAIIAPKDRRTRVTFRELNQECDRYAHGLARLGITRGTRTVLMVKPGVEFVGLSFALFKLGAVPVLIDPGMGKANLLACMEEVAPEAFIAVPLAQIAQAVAARAFKTVKFRVTVGQRFFWGGPTLGQIRESAWREFPCVQTRADEMAAILFTSGGTGPPKGVVYEHGMFDAQVRQLRDAYGIQEGEVDLPSFPLFALFSVAMGMTVVIPDMNPARPAAVDPAKFVAAIQQYQVTQSFGSPALWERIARFCIAQNVKLPSLKRVLIAGAPVQPRLLDRVKQTLAKNADAHTPYGATEALPVTTITAREVLRETAPLSRAGKGICVGKAFPDITVRIIPITDDRIPDWDSGLALPPEEIGEIVVSGPVVTRAYYRREKATAMAKIRDGAAWWHRMGDVGYLDKRERLWFCGRKQDRVQTASGTLFTIPCEAIFNQHLDVFRSALVGIGPVGSQEPVIIIEPHPEKFPASFSAKIRFTDELLSLGEANPLTAGITTILFHQEFPVDVRHNVKISRDLLAVWAAEQLRRTGRLDLVQLSGDGSGIRLVP